MANPFYTASGTPGTGAPGASAAQRNEFSLIQSAFDKLPAVLTPNALVVINSGGTGMTTTPGGVSALSTTGAFTTTFAQVAITTLTLPGVNGTLATLAGTETFTNKTLTAPIISTISNIGVLTLPTSTDTLVGRATTDTLTNKSMSGASNTFTAIPNAALSNPSVTIGSTNIALGATVTTFAGVTLTSPTFTAPALGTPASGVLTNCTGLPNASVIGLGSMGLRNVTIQSGGSASGGSNGDVFLIY